MTKVRRRPDALDQAGLVLGLDAFVKISAVEGLHLSAETFAMFADFDRKNLDDQERREAIIAKHLNKT